MEVLRAARENPVGDVAYRGGYPPVDEAIGPTRCGFLGVDLAQAKQAATHLDPERASCPGIRGRAEGAPWVRIFA